MALLAITTGTAGDTRLSRRHLRFGCWSFFVFAGLGLILETLHGFKVRAYLDVGNETRRLMWTLGHAHGTLLGLANVVVGLWFRDLPRVRTGRERLISRAFIGATLLLPGGFFLGGVRFYAGDPGLGVALVPIGAALLLLGAALLAISAGEGDAAVPTSRPARKP